MKVIQKKQSRASVLAMGLFVAAIVAAGTSQARGDEGVKPDREKFHAALKQCADENGITMTRGQRPSEENRQKMETCLTSKGISHPHHGRHRPDRDSSPAAPRQSDPTEIPESAAPAQPTSAS